MLLSLAATFAITFTLGVVAARSARLEAAMKSSMPAGVFYATVWVVPATVAGMLAYAASISATTLDVLAPVLGLLMGAYSVPMFRAATQRHPPA